jgi:hypothetical protein
MNTIHQKAAWFITALLLFTITISCEEQDAELTRRDGLISSPLGFSEKSSASISNGFSKGQLIQHAYEAYANWYDVTLTTKNTKVIDNATLQAWINANEKNKHKSINEKNKVALTEIANQGYVNALLVTAPVGAKFKQSVFIFGRFSSVLITDIIDIYEPRWIVVKKGLGFYGNGTLDPWGEISCDCTEEYIIIRPGEDYTKCGPCPDLGDL